MNQINIFSFWIMLLLTSVSAWSQSDKLSQLLGPYIGNWHLVLSQEEKEKNPERAHFIGFKLEWVHDNHKMIRFYEGIPGGDMDQRILETLVATNLRSGKVEFLGFQMRNDFFYEGSFEALDSGEGFIRIYDVYYPPGTKFRDTTLETKGMKTYRDVCKLVGRDTLECLTQQLNGTQWGPWGKGDPYRLTRKSPSNAVIPQWVRNNWAKRTAETGRWITANTEYKSEQEPYDAYGLQWEYGLGKNHLKGRLFCMNDGKEVGTLWTFTEFWDPATEKVRVLQIGSDGTVGQGTIWLEEDGKIKEQQVFTSPNRSSFESGHLTWMENGAQHIQSYTIKDGEWKKRRFYIWKLKP